ncbi:MAG TPA: flavin reductase family protein [Longimicrobiales bacterium]|nr:flavin reductase family protein [Longimicrobiales bacterium]
MSTPYEGTPYEMLRHLTLPIVAVTTSADGRRNGMIANSAQRASLVPHIGRISLYISKPNMTHDLVYRSGVFGIHLLRDDQYDVIRGLGLRSMREVEDKLDDFDVTKGVTGCPILDDCIAGFECTVVNAMDAGAATFFLGEIVREHEGSLDGTVMTSPHFREHAPADLLEEYEARLHYAQQILAPISGTITPQPWRGAVTRP